VFGKRSKTGFARAMPTKSAKDGKEYSITPEDIERVLADTDALVSLIESQEEKFAVDQDEEEDSEEI
jgi:hypothetical protein